MFEKIKAAWNCLLGRPTVYCGEDDVQLVIKALTDELRGRGCPVIYTETSSETKERLDVN